MPFAVEMRFIQAAETKLGRSLPPAYIAHMCKQNGGEVLAGKDEFTLYPIQDSSDRKRLARTCNDIIRETANAKEWRGFPPSALAIGDNGSGDKLILLPSSSGEKFADAVYCWDHETGQVQLVANSFEELN